MKHLLTALGILVPLFASFRVGFSLGTWHNCTTNACKSFFTPTRTCVTSPTCQCGKTTNQSTCGINTTTIANETGAVALDTSQGSLNCCMCETNSTFCCVSCLTTTTTKATTASTTSTTASTITPTTSSPVEKAILVAIFILNHDKTKYSSHTQELSLLFQYAVSNLTNTDNSHTTVTQTKFESGVRPYCGFNVDSYVNDLSNIVSSQGQCNSMVINATMTKKVPSSVSLANTIKLITDSVKDGNFDLNVWDGSKIKASFLLSKLFNSSYALHRGPDDSISDQTPTNAVPPIRTNLWPLIYSGIGVLSFIALCILYQCCKQSYLLRKKKYTDINSNRVNSKKKKLQDAMANQENAEREEQRQRGQFDMTHSQIQVVDNEALTRRYDWTTPAYVPNMLAPAYDPTELHSQRSPPRLMLDDDDSDSDKKSLGKASVINVDEETDEDLKDILESEDEDDVFKQRTNTRQSYASRNKSVSNKRKQSTTSKESKSSHPSRNTSPKSTEKIPNPAIEEERKSSYLGPEGREQTPSLSFGTLKSNRVTPVGDERKNPATSGKKKKKKKTKQ